MGVWIDTDMGFDDIAAILVVQSSGLAIDGVSLVFGNTTLQAVCGNAAGAVAAFGWSMPIHQGSAKPVLGALETAQSILGDSGIPTVGQSLPDAPALPKSDAFAALCGWLEGKAKSAFWRSARSPISPRFALPGRILPPEFPISPGWVAV